MEVAEAFRSIGITKDYGDLDRSGLEVDLQGWNSHHPMFRAALERARPSLVVEVGTWKGASVAHMHALSRELGLSTKFICVDTWLGSDEHWADPEYRGSLRLRHGYPGFFAQFVHNMIETGIMEDIFPLPLNTTAAAHLLQRIGLVPDLVYIDAGHHEEEVLIDLRLYHGLLRPGGVLLGDDYDLAWPGVVAAVNRFAAETGSLLTARSPKFMMAKPG